MAGSGHQRCSREQQDGEWPEACAHRRLQLRTVILILDRGDGPRPDRASPGERDHPPPPKPSCLPSAPLPNSIVISRR